MVCNVRIVCRFFDWYPAVSIVIGSPTSAFVVQSRVGLNVLNQGYPRMIRSCPKLAIKNRDLSTFDPCFSQRSQY